jgi:hypothetical protein
VTLEAGRDIVRGVLILLFAAVAFWLDWTTGLLLLAVMGLLILQSSLTNWCPADIFLRPLGLKSLIQKAMRLARWRVAVPPKHGDRI